MAYEVDWPLVLEYVKALAGPLVTLGGATLVASLGLRSFREQKTIERRLDWYQSVHRLLGDVANSYGLAGNVTDPVRKELHTQRASELSSELARLANEGWLYADQASFEATQLLFHQMAQVHQAADSRGAISPALAAQVTDICHATANHLAIGMRKELRQPEMRVLSPEEIRKRIAPAA